MASKAPPSLQTISSLLVSVRFRDQSLKLVQYTLKMLHPFYSKISIDPDEDLIHHAQQMISNSRKIFRLFKSINNLSRLYTTSQLLAQSTSENIIKHMSMLEDFLWSIFYVYDHQLFFLRTKLLVKDAESLLLKFSLCWFSATLIAFARTIYQTYLWRQEKLQLCEDATAARHEEMEAVRRDLLWRLLKSGLNVGVAGSYPALPVWEKVFGLPLSESAAGFMGLVSAAMDLWETWPDAPSHACPAPVECDYEDTEENSDEAEADVSFEEYSGASSHHPPAAETIEL